jgi:8-oxo-dGTP pyrophosphatase MutT (NUDIX family)
MDVKMHLLEKKRPDTDSSTSAKVLAFKDNKLLLLKNKDNTYELPGGHVKIGEPLVAGAMREFFEETGIQVYTLKMIKQKPNRVFYKTTIFTRQVKLSDEHIGFDFISINNLYKVKLSKKAYKDLIFLKK